MDNRISNEKLRHLLDKRDMIFEIGQFELVLDDRKFSYDKKYLWDILPYLMSNVILFRYRYIQDTRKPVWEI